jgi:hypothetical protein
MIRSFLRIPVLTRNFSVQRLPTSRLVELGALRKWDEVSSLLCAPEHRPLLQETIGDAFAKARSADTVSHAHDIGGDGGMLLNTVLEGLHFANEIDSLEQVLEKIGSDHELTTAVGARRLHRLHSIPLDAPGAPPSRQEQSNKLISRISLWLTGLDRDQRVEQVRVLSRAILEGTSNRHRRSGSGRSRPAPLVHDPGDFLVQFVAHLHSHAAIWSSGHGNNTSTATPTPTSRVKGEVTMVMASEFGRKRHVNTLISSLTHLGHRGLQLLSADDIDVDMFRLALFSSLPELQKEPGRAPTIRTPKQAARDFTPSSLLPVTKNVTKTGHSQEEERKRHEVMSAFFNLCRGDSDHAVMLREKFLEMIYRRGYETAVVAYYKKMLDRGNHVTIRCLNFAIAALGASNRDGALSEALALMDLTLTKYESEKEVGPKDRDEQADSKHIPAPSQHGEASQKVPQKRSCYPNIHTYMGILKILRQADDVFDKATAVDLLLKNMVASGVAPDIKLLALVADIARDSGCSRLAMHAAELATVSFRTQRAADPPADVTSRRSQLPGLKSRHQQDNKDESSPRKGTLRLLFSRVVEAVAQAGDTTDPADISTMCDVVQAQMCEVGIKPSLSTLKHLLRCFERAERYGDVLTTWERLRTEGAQRSTEDATNVIAALARLGRLRDARLGLDGLEKQGRSPGFEAYRALLGELLSSGGVSTASLPSANAKTKASAKGAADLGRDSPHEHTDHHHLLAQEYIGEVMFAVDALSRPEFSAKFALDATLKRELRRFWTTATAHARCELIEQLDQHTHISGGTASSHDASKCTSPSTLALTEQSLSLSLSPSPHEQELGREATRGTDQSESTALQMRALLHRLEREINQ